jgi:hypothetical protein
MKWLLLCLLLFACIPFYSQNFYGGVLIGFTASQVDGDSYAGYNRIGLCGGVFVRREISPLFNLNMEVRYASRGAFNPAADDNAGKYLLGLHYIDIPLWMDIKIKNYGAFEIGVIPGYLFHTAGKDDAGKMPGDYLVVFKKLDVGTLLGISIRLMEKFSLSIRYSYSIFSIREVKSATATYSWFGSMLGHSQGDFNNYLTTGIRYQLK